MEEAMPVPARLDAYIETEKQRHFSRDFIIGWENYENWEQATVGDSGPALRTFWIAEEDIVSYNRACGETAPLMIDPVYARQNSPTGEVLQQRIEIIEPFRYGEVITTTVTTVDKFVQRNKPYLQMLLDFRNEKGVLKARWWCSLILPETQADVARFANA